MLPIKGTGDWLEQSVPLKRKVTGTHDVYLVARGERQVAALDWLTIRR